MPDGLHSGDGRGYESMKRTQVLVIGAGPAGIAAAIAAAEAGLQVTVLDDNPSAGGQIWRRGTVAEGSRSDSGGGAKQRALDRLSRSGATVLPGMRVFDAQASGVVDAVRETASHSAVERFGFEQLVLATGARERFLPFPGWTLPGVFGAGGLQALAKGGYEVRGKRIVVSGSGPLLLAVAAHLARDGAVVSTVAEQAGIGRMARFAASLWSHPGKLVQGAGYRAKLWRTAHRSGCWVTQALPSPNGQGLRGVLLSDGTREWEEPCDLLACGFHLVPNTEVASLLGCAFRGSYVRVDKTQRTSVEGVYCAGEPTGIAGLDAALLQGEIAGLQCAGRDTDVLRGRAKVGQKFQIGLEKAFALRPELSLLAKPETIVCRCEDIAFGALQGRLGWVDAKLQTRCGMGPCQGRVCGPAVEHLLGWKPVSVRQPLSPVPIEVFCSYNEDELNEEKV
jgi:NADPH-dependent 2,4-dienoyl-CoA reductase/sulfur reductase-like enzyme